LIRLLQAMAGARHGGAEAFFVRLAIALQAAGQEQRVVIRRDADRAAALRRGGIDPLELRFGQALDAISRFRFRRAVAEYQPDVVLTWMNRASQACPVGKFVRVGRLGGYYDLKHYRSCDHLIANTQDILGYIIRQGWPAERVHYLPNFASAEAAPALDRASLNTPEDAPVALALGRLHPNKAFDVLLAAVAQVPEIFLWVAGDGPLRRTLEREAAQLRISDRVRFLGWRDDTARLFATVDFVVCPSRREPLGNVVLEAWAANLPIVAAASAGPSELVINEETGILVPVDDADALARAMQRLRSDPVLGTRLSRAARTVYDQHFSEAKVVGLYRTFFERVAR
jgi:glycosyltransferase involved in cell wall biosynthesis